MLIITDKGRDLFLKATFNLIELNISYFKVTDQDISVNTSTEDIPSWMNKEIAYITIENGIIKIGCSITETEAISPIQIIGIYDIDDNLIVINKLDNILAPGNHNLIINIKYDKIATCNIPSNTNELFDTQLNILNNLILTGNQITKNTLILSKLDIPGVTFNPLDIYLNNNKIYNEFPEFVKDFTIDIQDKTTANVNIFKTSIIKTIKEIYSINNYTTDSKKLIYDIYSLINEDFLNNSTSNLIYEDYLNLNDYILNYVLNLKDNVILNSKEDLINLNNYEFKNTILSLLIPDLINNNLYNNIKDPNLNIDEYDNLYNSILFQFQKYQVTELSLATSTLIKNRFNDITSIIDKLSLNLTDFLNNMNDIKNIFIDINNILNNEVDTLGLTEETSNLLKTDIQIIINILIDNYTLDSILTQLDIITNNIISNTYIIYVLLKNEDSIYLIMDDILTVYNNLNNISPVDYLQRINFSYLLKDTIKNKYLEIDTLNNNLKNSIDSFIYTKTEQDKIIDNLNLILVYVLRYMVNYHLNSVFNILPLTSLNQEDISFIQKELELLNINIQDSIKENKFDSVLLDQESLLLTIINTYLSNINSRLINLVSADIQNQFSDELLYISNITLSKLR